MAIHGYTPAEVQLSRPVNDPNTLILTFAGTTDKVTLLYGADSDRFDGIEEIAFDDGTVWTMAQLRTRLVAEAKTAGNDLIEGFDSAADIVDGGAGNDTLRGQDGADTLVGGLGNDRLEGGIGSNCYEFTRGDGVDTVRDQGWFATDRVAIHGYTPSEVAVSRPVNDPDTLILTFAGTSDHLTLTYGADSDRFDGIEEIAFDDGTLWTMAQLRTRLLAEAKSAGNDLIEGFDSAADIVDGGAGNDTLRGQWGNDTLVGGLGNDTLTGGGNLDVFVFDTAPAADNHDHITDFWAVDDTIRLDDAVFTALSAPGMLAAGAFFIGAAAQDADDRIIYNAVTGALSYDEDGSGSIAAVQFATLGVGLALTHADFAVV